ncbi:hypothetical protein BS78_04G119300 [Paspalum vaginatum]|nr:hypothetical protein BS78_04G119300 [Paspalum vaginatum]
MRPAALASLFFLLSLVLVVTVPVASASVAGVPPTSAPWVTITNIGDDLYRQVGRFALLMRALVLREEYLDLVQVLSGSVQAAGVGNNYSLLLLAADRNGTVGTYKAVAWGVPRSRDWPWKLVDFQRVVAPSPGTEPGSQLPG